MTDDFDDVIEDVFESDERDSERIDVILSELREYWLANPDLRLSQIISIIANKNGFGDDPFYMEDDTVLNQLEEDNTN